MLNIGQADNRSTPIPVPFSRNIQKMNSYQTLNSKLNKDEPLKAVKVIDLLFFYFVLGLIDITPFIMKLLNKCLN